MQKRHLPTVLASMLLLSSFVIAHHPALSPVADRVTVEQAAQEELGDKDIVIYGRVIKQTGPNTVLIQDRTGTIEVEVPPDQVPENGFRTNNSIRIRGSVKGNDGDARVLGADHIYWSF